MPHKGRLHDDALSYGFFGQASDMETEDRKPHINVDYFEDLTGDITDSKNDPVEEIGTRINAIRAA